MDKLSTSTKRIACPAENGMAAKCTAWQLSYRGNPVFRSVNHNRWSCIAIQYHYFNAIIIFGPILSLPFTKMALYSPTQFAILPARTVKAVILVDWCLGCMWHLPHFFHSHLIFFVGSIASSIHSTITLDGSHISQAEGALLGTHNSLECLSQSYASVGLTHRPTRHQHVLRNIRWGLFDAYSGRMSPTFLWHRSGLIGVRHLLRIVSLLSNWFGMEIAAQRWVLVLVQCCPMLDNTGLQRKPDEGDLQCFICLLISIVGG